MTEKFQERRRVLIVDDQQAIHDTFDRVFAEKQTDDDALADFESRFLASVSGETTEHQQQDGRDANVPQYSLVHAHSGEQALELARAAAIADNAFAVAFVDMRMPGLDGLETTEQLWQIDPNLQVVICTAYSDHMWDDVLKKLGYNDRLLLLRKPFESDEARQLALALSEKSRLALIQQQKVEDLGQEIERRRTAEDNMRDMAHRDALTSLPNRQYLLEKLEKLVENHRDRRDRPQDAVLFLDLDNFKIINDSLGHDAGDDLLNQVAARLKECVREHDTASRVCDEEEKTVRLGGDEFVVLLEELADAKDAIHVAQRIVKRISDPFQLGDRYVTVGTSVGLAYIDHHVADAGEALRNADTAMYRAKHSGKGQISIFDQTMHEAVVARMELEDKLRRAVKDKAFELHYQPIVSLSTASIQGVEVLMRWRDEQGKFVPPSQFISIIEEIGLITHVGEWVLETAMRDFGNLVANLPGNADRSIYLGVNVSPRQLGDLFFLSRLNEIIARTGFDRRLLKLEMNESGGTRHSKLCMDTMLELHASGVGIQIDDFGKGHSSLTCFQSYPIETVKIDRSFTASIASDHSHAVIAQAIVQLAHHLNAKIIAEGVESKQQLESLRKWRCDAVQGYLFSPPLELHQLDSLLRNQTNSEGIKLLRSGTLPPLDINIPSPTQQINLS